MNYEGNTETSYTYPNTYEEARIAEDVAARLVAVNVGNKDAEQTEATRAVLRSIEKYVPSGLYEHFKSTPETPKHYLVTGIVDDINTGLCYVKYSAQYGAYKGQERLRVLTGPDSWLNPIDRPTYKGVRFRKVAK